MSFLTGTPSTDSYQITYQASQPLVQAQPLRPLRRSSWGEASGRRIPGASASRALSRHPPWRLARSGSAKSSRQACVTASGRLGRPNSALSASLRQAAAGGSFTLDRLPSFLLPTSGGIPPSNHGSELTRGRLGAGAAGRMGSHPPGRSSSLAGSCGQVNSS